MSEPGQRGGDAWEQTAWIWSALLYGVLAVATALALMDGQPRGRDRFIMLGLAAVMAAWHLAFERLGIPRRSPVPVLVYWTGLVTIWFFLAGLHPAYFSLLSGRPLSENPGRSEAGCCRCCSGPCSPSGSPASSSRAPAAGS